VSGILTCDDVTERNLVEGFVAGTLPGDELEAFEAHYLTCRRCQAELRLATAVRSTLPGIDRAAARRRWPVIAAAAAVAAAAVITSIVFLRPSSSDDGLAALGGVDQAPVYLGVEIRGESGAADSLFELGMSYYLQKRYDQAATTLDASLSVAADLVPAEFFLAVSRLMNGEPDAAVPVFGRLIERGETPYLAEAYYYRAKAFLRLNRADEALSDLRAAAAAGGVIGVQAVALVDSVKSWLQR
jgi:tetratricopeptide (TPR) repeat protein